ncbi:DUF3108 domain-containing protein [Extensimonas vulgaris]|uniref:Uncharacterized protein DUF3108 n=1 Tax=Extensimonas vulgaris TaxID=1031594 RepID=A0A369ALX8_9BURK|nr:DUF3108 domain-containing protein [Extensimonas vulgaris]RCX10171.1 uncharacterized protein DUF3108 [Extensimonas vulgaris]TWI39752.1 uncharacterized protein DUF3108 [Extensimonas vulgaris]TXD17316.1 DUF3108 domain-containing protein [Extensimonas vulgaris]
MQTRHFLTLTLLVLALHLLLLGGLPLQMGGGGTPSAAAPLVFSTRSIPAPLASPEPPATSAEAPPAPTSQAAPTPTARKKPPRRKPAAPVAEPSMEPSVEPTDQATAAAQTQAQPDEAARAPADAEEAAQPGHAGQEAQEEQQGPADRLASVAEPPATGAAGASMAASSTPAVAAAPVVSAAAASSPAAPMEAASTARAAAIGSDSDAGLEILAPGAAAEASAASRTPPPVRIPPPMRLEFDAQGLVKGLHYTASAQLLWQHDGSRYQARQEVRVFLLGTRAQTSTGSITAQGLRPERFGDIARRELAAHFDYAQGRVIFSANTPQAPLRAGAQDRLSVFIQLGAMFAAQPQRFVPGTRISVPTIGPRSADRWVFAVRALETLHLPAGDIPAWRLERLPERDYDQKAELWLSPDFEYLPVRIRLTQSNGDYVDLQLRSSGPP